MIDFDYQSFKVAGGFNSSGIDVLSRWDGKKCLKDLQRFKKNLVKKFSEDNQMKARVIKQSENI